MNSINKVILIGNVGNDPVIRPTKHGEEIATFDLATSSKSCKEKDSYELKTIVEWHNVVIYDPSSVSFTKTYLKKGSRIYVEGTIQTTKYLDKTGNKKKIKQIVVQKRDGKIVSFNTNEAPNAITTQSYNLEEQDALNSNDDFGNEIPF